MPTILQRAELDCIGFDVSNNPVTQGRMELRWRKLTYLDGQLVATDYHRATVDVDTDIDATIEMIDADLERQGFGRMPKSDPDYIKRNAELAWTPEVRAAVAADRLAQAEREAAERAADETAAAQREAADKVALAGKLRELGVVLN